MSTIKPTLAVIIFLSFTVKAHSQWRDFVVTLQNDTLYGELRYRFNMPFALVTGQAEVEINERTISSYFSASHKYLYRRKNLPGKKRFMLLPCLEIGRINLYGTSANPGGVDGKTTVTYYAEKEDNQLVEVWTNKGVFGNSNKGQREALKALIADNPAAKQIFDGDTKYDAVDVQYYIHEYNKGTAQQ